MFVFCWTRIFIIKFSFCSRVSHKKNEFQKSAKEDFFLFLSTLEWEEKKVRTGLKYVWGMRFAGTYFETSCARLHKKSYYTWSTNVLELAFFSPIICSEIVFFLITNIKKISVVDLFLVQETKTSKNKYQNKWWLWSFGALSHEFSALSKKLYHWKILK